MKKGVNAWCYPADMPLEQVFAAAARAGFAGVEPNLEEKGPFSLESSDADYGRIRAAALAAGIEITSICTGLLWKHPLSDPDRAVADRGRAVVRKMIEAAAALGTDTVLVVPGVVTEDNPYDEVYERSLDAVRALAADGEAAGVGLGIENVWNKFLLSPLEAAGFMDAAGSDMVGAYLDVGNLLLYGFPQHWVRILGPRIRKVHVKDFRTGPKEFVHLPAGDVNWPEVKSALESVGYDDYLVVELGPYKHYPLQAARDMSAALDRILGAEAEL